MPRNPRARPSGEVVALSEAYRSFRMPESEVGFSELIAQSNGAVLVRIPVNQPSAGR
jgi:hypothetical protein